MMNDHIYLFSPSGAVDPAALERAVTHLHALGWRVTVDRLAAKRVMRFAGTDAERLAAFGRAAASKADIAMITRGGYGITRYLPRLDFAALRASGKRWVGHSDFTAFSLALLARSRGASYLGPTGHLFAGEPGVQDAQAVVDEVTLGSFREMMDGSAEAVGWPSPGSPRCAVQGTLWGGNLSIVATLIGTPYLPKPRGIFFCEDVAETPYRVERMLTHLLLAGVLQRQRAVVLGQFTDYTLTPHDAGFDMPVVVRWLREQLKPHGVPVITGLPFSHGPVRLTLPVGRKVHLLVEQGSAFLVYH
jgi:muramoyltetrapeptide carboxypeptidase